MREWSFVASLINLNLITVDVALQLCPYALHMVRSEAFKELGR